MASFKNLAKRAVRKTPVLKSLFLRLDYFQNKINECEERLNQSESKINTLYAEMNERFSQDQKLIEDLTLQNRNCKLQQRFLFKALNSTPVKVVYIVEELSVTKNILSVIKKQNEDKNFEVILLNMWYKSYKGENYTFVRPDIEKIIDKNEYTVIESYNPETDSWIDLEALNPDYVFFPRPYDYYRKEEYHIPVVAKYARTCYIPYCIQTIGGEVEDMMLTKESGYLDYFFLDNSLRKTVVDAALCDTQFSKIGHSVYCGYPGFDMLRSAKEIKNNDTKTFTVLWLPRWHTGEGNCHFFDYIYVLLDYALADENSRIILRPHPLCFQNFINSGELTEEQLEGIKERYSEPNRIDMTPNYIEAFSKSSVLVADETSLIAEYFLTDKPIIFCKKKMHLSNLMEKLLEGCYVVENEEQLIKTLDKIKSGEDTLKEKRIELSNQYLIDYGNSAADNISAELLADFRGKYVV